MITLILCILLIVSVILLLYTYFIYIPDLISFYDISKNVSKVSGYIPKSTYQISSDSKNRVLSYCNSEEEKIRVINELPMYTREYYIETSRGVFRVRYGIPELINTPQYHYLSQTQINDILSLFKDTLTEFNIMWTILHAEREHISSYKITDGKKTVIVKDGEYSLFITT